jgi:hypothetical protein
MIELARLEFSQTFKTSSSNDNKTSSREETKVLAHRIRHAITAD